MPEVRVPQPQLTELCRRHHIRRLWLFGSMLRGDGGPHSDVDVLVEFQQGHTPGWEIVDIEDDFSQLFGGRKVDMVNPKYLSRRLKDRVLAAAQLQYEQGHREG